MRHRLPLLIVFVYLALSAAGQTVSEEDRFISKFKTNDVPLPDLLASRSAVLYSANCSAKNLEELQKGFQQFGVDAISYVESGRAMAGVDLMNAYARYFIKRNVKILIFLRKENSEFKALLVPFNSSTSWVNPEQNAWYVHSMTVGGVLQTIYRGVIATQKRQNLLINDFPEYAGPFGAVSAAGRRDENLAPNIRGLRVAIPRTGNATNDTDLENYAKELTLKYEMVDYNVEEKDLIQKGFVYVLRFIHSPGAIAKEVLGYDMSKTESALATVSYSNGQMQLKTIPSETIVYKFYIKHLDDGIFYLGTKWDADINFVDALRNHFDGYRAAGRLY